MGSLAKLPSELWSAILEQLDQKDQSSTSAALMIAFPKAPVDFKHVWMHIHLRNELQVKALNMKLMNDREMKLILQSQSYLGQSLRHTAMLGDPYFLINVYESLKHVQLLSIFVGPAFAPEHLSEFFNKPRNNLRTLNIHFRPYLKRRSYYQFLKGAYFDSTLEQLALNWPINPNLSRLSFIQDNPPSLDHKESKERLPLHVEQSEDLIDHSTYLESYSGGPTSYFKKRILTDDLPKKFAHPIVFFNLSHCLTQFSTSPFASSIEHMRLIIPQRDVATSLAIKDSLPKVKSIDLSTTIMKVIGPDANLSNLLRKLRNLEYLILDQTDVLGTDVTYTNVVARDRARKSARAIGQMSATTGLVHAKNIEIAINEWVAEQRASFMQFDESIIERQQDERNEEVAQPRRRINTGRRAFQANFSIRTEQTPDTRTLPRLSNAAKAYLENAPVKYLVLPELPKLKALTVGVSDQVKKCRREEWHKEFEKGWREGCNKVVETIEQIYKAWMKSIEDDCTGDGSTTNKTITQKTKNKYKTYGKSNNQPRAQRSQVNKKKVEIIKLEDAKDNEISQSTLPNNFKDHFKSMSVCLDEKQVLELIERASDREYQVPIFCTKAKCEHPRNGDSDGESEDELEEGVESDKEEEIIECPSNCAHRVTWDIWKDV